jgi:uncharacterized membrane protein
MQLPRASSRHWNFYIAAVAGIVAAIVTLVFARDLFPAIAASIFSLTYLALTARDMPKLTPDYLREHAGDEDAPPWIVFILTIAVVVYVTVALFMTVNDSNPQPLTLWLGGISVALAWLMINTMWGMHYAWEYYDAPKTGDDAKQQGGLEFAGDEDPDGMDFIYYAMVVGMTDQTSDTNVTSRLMRRITTGHSLFSYLFNTVIVAAAINVVVSLAHG